MLNEAGVLAERFCYEPFLETWGRPLSIARVSGHGQQKSRTPRTNRVSDGVIQSSDN